MDSIARVLDSDNESDLDVLELNTVDDLPVEDEDDCPTNTTEHKIGSVWRDMVVGEQMEGRLTRLKVTTKKPSYTDMDDPNYSPMNKRGNKGYKRKRCFSSYAPNQNTENVSENGDLESNHVTKKRYANGNGNFNNCYYKYTNSKGFVPKRDVTNHKCRVLPNICDSEGKTFDKLLDELCTNLHEHNKPLMLSVISQIDREIILDKYNETCVIEANGGQMVKNGNRRRTSGGIFLNLIKEDKSIPNSAKKALFGSTQNEEIKKKKKQEKMKRKKEKLKKLVLQDSKEAVLKKLTKEQETVTSSIALNHKELQLSDTLITNNI